ncbi:MAG: ATP-binding protein [Rikenellaceae bacterium]
MIRVLIHRLWLCALFIAIALDGFCQHSYRFSPYLSIDNLLNNNTINTIFEDSRGYVWIGTSVDLNRYDGQEVITYKNRLGEELLCSSRVLSLNEDRYGRLWIGTDKGVEIYDVDQERFLTIYKRASANRLIETSPVVAIEPSADGQSMICASENRGLLIYDINTLSVRSENDRWVDIVGFKPLDENRYVVAAKERLSIYDLRDGAVEDIPGVLFGEGDIIRDFIITPSALYVVLNRGLREIRYSYDEQRDEYKFTPHTSLYYPDEKLQYIYKDRGGRIFLTGLKAGLYILPSVDMLGAEYKIIGETLQVSTIVEMRGSDYIWFGSRFSGIYRLDSGASIFRDLHFSDNPLFRLYRIDRYDDNTLLIGGTSPDRFLYDVRLGERVGGEGMDNLPARATPFLLRGEPYALDCSRQGRLLHYKDGRWGEVAPVGDLDMPTMQIASTWVEGERGVWFSAKERISRLQITDRLYRLLIVDGDQPRYRLQQLDLPVASNELQKIRDIEFDQKRGRAWVGTATQGLYQIDNLSAEEITLEDITHLYDDGEYIKGEGLRSIPSNFVSAMTLAGDKLYIGNYMGLFRGREVDGCYEFGVYTKESGLPNDAVKALVGDGRGRVVISTARGISIFDCKREHFYNYDTSDGLPFYAFSDYAIRLNEREVVLCSNEKAVIFDPGALEYSQRIPNIEFGELRIFNNRLHPGDEIDGKIAIKRRLTDGDTIRLDHKSNMLSIDLHLLHYGHPQRYSIRYRFAQSLDSAPWLYRSSTNRTISFSELKHGSYQFEVAGSNSNGEWGESKSLVIIIAPPLWLRWWAYIIYLALAAVVSYILVRLLLRLQSLRHRVEIDEMNRREERDRQQYISNIAHEIKTPLSLVVSTAETLHDQYGHDRSISAQLTFVQRQSSKISKMVDTVQSIYLNKHGYLRPSPTTFEFNGFINAIVDDFKVLAQNQKKTLDITSPPHAVYVKGDCSMLERVVHNLLNNAHKYTHEGGAIHVEWSLEGRILILTVADDGIGISPEEMGRIFERYYRSDAVRERSVVSGSGIGLDFSRQLVEMHGGQISATSRLAEGSCFEVRLPIVVEGELGHEREASAEDLILEPVSYEQQEGAKSDELIFVVEDNDDLREMVLSFVGRGYKAEGYADGAAALEALSERCPDLILSDVAMPRVDGYDLALGLKSNIATSHIPIILITACTSIEEKIRCRQVGADIYISKPFYPKYVMACIETTLRNHKAIRERYRVGEPIQGATDLQSEKSNEFMEQLYRFMDEVLSMEDIDLNKMAIKMGLNRTYFYQKVKAMTNMTPYEFVKEYRLIKASEMLRRGDMSILEVCCAVGFKNRTHFSRVFKERFGIAPSRYS